MSVEALALAVAMARWPPVDRLLCRDAADVVLAADPLSHIALPGVGIALALRINPIFGAAALLFFGALLVWALEQRTRAATETMIGIVFSAALAIGSMMTSGEELIDALFGTNSALSRSELIFGLVGAVGVIVFIVTKRDSLIVMLVSPEVARTTGINVGRLDLLYLEAFALTIALGLRYLGVLLMGALIIVPAATAKGLARNLTGMLYMAAGIAVLATVVGTWAGVWLHRASGPLIVLSATSVFLLSLAREPT